MSASNEGQMCQGQVGTLFFILEKKKGDRCLFIY
jgi:hypothetical protein